MEAINKQIILEVKNTTEVKTYSVNLMAEWRRQKTVQELEDSWWKLSNLNMEKKIAGEKDGTEPWGTYVIMTNFFLTFMWPESQKEEKEYLVLKNIERRMAENFPTWWKTHLSELQNLRTRDKEKTHYL